MAAVDTLPTQPHGCSLVMAVETLRLTDARASNQMWGALNPPTPCRLLEQTFVRSQPAELLRDYRACYPVEAMYLKILAHPVFPNLNFHMPMIVDLSHPLIMLRGENGCGKSTLLHSIYYALRGEQVEGYVYRLEQPEVKLDSTFLFDAEQHNPRQQLEFFNDQPEMLDFLKTASHGQVMLALFRESFPRLPEGSILLLDEPEMALSVSNQHRILKMLMELVDQKHFRIICATHSPVLIDAPETYVINLDQHINRNVVTSDMGIQGASTIQ